MTAGAGLLQNQGLSVSPAFANAVVAYDTCSLITPLIEVMASGGGYSGLYTIGANTCPALGDSVPAAYNPPLSTSSTGWIDSIPPIGAYYMGSGDLSKFAQAESICQGYADTINPFITSAVNSQTYLANTFTNTNNMVTGDITSVNTATAIWGQDLINLGRLINLANLDELGTPLALVKQIAQVGAITPGIALTFSDNGVPIEVVVNINSPTLSTTDTVQKLMYHAMTKITGSALTEVLQILQVKTAGIDTMADLLNPYKLFPNSFQTLTVTNNNGVSTNIYLDSTGTVNMQVAQGLPSTVVSSLS